MPSNPEAQSSTSSSPSEELAVFDALLTKEFKARDVQKQSAVQSAVRTLAEQALSATKLVSTDALKTISAFIAAG